MIRTKSWIKFGKITKCIKKLFYTNTRILVIIRINNTFLILKKYSENFFEYFSSLGNNKNVNFNAFYIGYNTNVLCITYNILTSIDVLKNDSDT